MSIKTDKISENQICAKGVPLLQSPALSLRRHLRLACATALLLYLAAPRPSHAQSEATIKLSEPLGTSLDQALAEAVRKSGVPSASIGIVQGGKVVYLRAFGAAKLDPTVPAEPSMAYPIGSITKQFTAACLLLLMQDGKLTIDDPVSRWLPQLTRAHDVTIAELLSHTSGYEDYAPQDYTIPAWTKPVDPQKLVNEWADKPLDFDPGTMWQYSNTNFVVASLIIEKASGMSYFAFLRKRILEPLGLSSALDLDTQRGQLRVKGYERRALGPLRPAILEAPGWYYGDANLALTVGDLLRWDLSLIDRRLLSGPSYDRMESEVMLKGGGSTGYGLGMEVKTSGGRRLLEHSGEVGGFVSENMVWPDDKTALAVLTNQEGPGAIEIAHAVAPLLFSTPETTVADPASAGLEAQVKSMLTDLEEGRIDAHLLTTDCAFYFSSETLGDFSSSLKPLGPVTKVTQNSHSLRGGMTYRDFSAHFAGGRTVTVSTYWTADGRLEQFLVEATR